MPTGGDIIEITYNHATVGSGVLFCKSAEDNTFDAGGFRSADDMNMVDSGGNMLDQVNRARWSVEAVISNDMNTREEMERINELAASPLLATWTFSHINGTVYTGTGKPVGDIAVNVNQSTFTLKVSGGGKLKKQ